MTFEGDWRAWAFGVFCAAFSGLIAGAIIEANRDQVCFYLKEGPRTRYSLKCESCDDEIPTFLFTTRGTIHQMSWTPGVE